jgi:Flp pilus assembly protein CpaB
LVTPEQTRKLELAKNQGKISLALRNPLDRSTSPNDKPTTAVALGAETRAKVPDVRDNRTWEQLTRVDLAKPEKKEPPKPRSVIDVYRGDKHVQEVFP